jgi:hypothetical protein
MYDCITAAVSSTTQGEAEVISIMDSLAPTYHLDLKTTLDATLSDITLSAFGFPGRIGPLNIRTAVVFQLHNRNTEAGRPEEHATIMKTIVEHVLLFLSDMMFHAPLQARRDTITEVSINGHGISVHAILKDMDVQETRMVVNSRIHLSTTIASDMASGRGDRVRRDPMADYPPGGWADDLTDTSFARILAYDRVKLRP